jgi:electron transport complex protein RnfE
MILPPGGFLALGFLLAGRRVLEARLAARMPAAAAKPRASA